MIRYKELLTLKIISQKNNESVGKVVDLLYSDDYRKITNFIVKNNNLIKNKTKIPYNDINFDDNDRILILGEDEVLEYEKGKGTGEEFKFIDKEIRFKNNECVGYVKDIVINIYNGSIEGFIITEGIVEDLIKGRNYLPLFDNTIIKDNCIYISNKNLN